jgi:hypothetical protein
MRYGGSKELRKSGAICGLKKRLSGLNESMGKVVADCEN